MRPWLDSSLCPVLLLPQWGLAGTSWGSGIASAPEAGRLALKPAVGVLWGHGEEAKLRVSREMLLVCSAGHNGQK